MEPAPDPKGRTPGLDALWGVRPFARTGPRSYR